MSMSLYNELRPPIANEELMKNYTWEFWYDQMRRGSSAIHTANPDVLIVFSGLLGDNDLSVVVDGTALEPSNATFSKSDFAGYENKLVLELHSYPFIISVDTCPMYNTNLFDAGYSTTTSNATNRFPMLMTEFGFAQDDTTWRNDTYATCALKFLKDVVPGSGWFIWVVGGSYYIRQGKQDYDESYGLLTHDWSGWRSPSFIEGSLKPLVSSTLSAVSGDV